MNAPLPSHRAHSLTVIHSSYPFLLVALCFWIWSQNPVREITNHFECLNPWGLVSPSQLPTGRRNEQRKKSESLYFSLTHFGILQMYHSVGKDQTFWVPISFLRGSQCGGPCTPTTLFSWPSPRSVMLNEWWAFQWCHCPDTLHF